MPSYITLMNLTDQGIKDVKDIPGRIDKGLKAWEAMGGKTLAFYMTMGPYDYVAVTEAPNDEVAAAFSLALGAQGFVRTTGLKAFNRDEVGAIIARVP